MPFSLALVNVVDFGVSCALMTMVKCAENSHSCVFILSHSVPNPCR